MRHGIADRAPTRIDLMNPRLLSQIWCCSARVASASGKRAMPLAAALVIGAAATPAEARPFVYLGSSSYNGEVTTCIANAEAALRRLGFNRDLEKKIETADKFGSVYSYLPTDPVTVEIQCIQKEAITIWAVAGLDNALTFDNYKQVSGASW